MPAAVLPDYLHLNRANNQAPHKPVLLLAVLKAFDEGLIIENRIEPTGELINLFNGYWSLLVHDPTYQRRIYYPFFYMKNERSGLWALHTLPGFEKTLSRGRDIKSLGALLAYQAYAVLDRNVFNHWTIPENRAADRLALMAYYFPGQTLPPSLPDQLHELEQQIVRDSPDVYIARVKEGTTDVLEEDKQLRGAAFQRKVPQLYDYRCAITGLRVNSQGHATLIDACHIVPWADSFNDTITNGIALCPNMHRAFDRGLISIADDLTVLVAADLRENESSHAISPFSGKPLLLPAEQENWPARENLSRHRERFGF